MTVQLLGPAWLRQPAERWGLPVYLRSTELSLIGRSYDDAAIQHVVRLQQLKTITLDNTRVSSKGEARLRQALPKCRIERTPRL